VSCQQHSQPAAAAAVFGVAVLAARLADKPTASSIACHQDLQHPPAVQKYSSRREENMSGGRSKKSRYSSSSSSSSSSTSEQGV